MGFPFLPLLPISLLWLALGEPQAVARQGGRAALCLWEAGTQPPALGCSAPGGLTAASVLLGPNFGGMSTMSRRMEHCCLPVQFA